MVNPFEHAPTDVDPATGDPAEAHNAARKRHRIKVAGGAPPPPLRGFGELATRFHLNARLLHNLATMGHDVPTPVQRQAIPTLLSGRDVLAVAPTGSGKTLAFLVPMVAQLLPAQKTGRARTSDGLKGLVISPTKELAMQTARAMARLCTATGMRHCCLTKATAVGSDFSKVCMVVCLSTHKCFKTHHQVDLLSATPLLLDRLLTKQRVDLRTCSMLVLDEADQLLQGGFVHQVDLILQAASNPQLVRALFSATLPESVEHSARSVMRDPLHIVVGQRNSATCDVEQRLVFVGQEKGRLLAMRCGYNMYLLLYCALVVCKVLHNVMPLYVLLLFTTTYAQGLGPPGPDTPCPRLCLEQGASSGAASGADVRRRGTGGQHPCRSAGGAARCSGGQL